MVVAGGLGCQCQIDITFMACGLLVIGSSEEGCRPAEAAAGQGQ